MNQPDVVSMTSNAPVAVSDRSEPLLAVDFGVMQVVDVSWGVHAIIRKAMFTD